MSEISLPVSLGEALDKLTILDIKRKKISDFRKEDVVLEFNILYEKLKNYVEKYSYYYRILYDINMGLWNLQELFHNKDTTADAGAKICRTILIENDRRFRVKAKLNMREKSLLKEQKGYGIKKVVLYSHLGLGDMFWMNGAVRYLSTDYDEVLVVCKKINEKNVEAMYRDDPTIKLYIVYTDEDLKPWEEKQKIFIDRGYTVLSCGFFSSRKEVVNLPLSFYDDISLPHHVRNTYFYIPESETSKELVKEYKEPYIVVHEESSGLKLPIVETLKKRGEKRLILDLNKNSYLRTEPEWEKAEKVVNRPILEYINLLENAEELHLIESSVYCLASHLDLRKVCNPWGGNSERLGIFTTGEELNVAIPVQSKEEINYTPGQINRDCALGEFIYQIAKNEKYKYFLDVGTWNGQGSTRCLVEGIRERSDANSCIIYSVETNLDMYKTACSSWEKENVPYLRLIHGRIADKMMTEEEIVKHPLFPKVALHYFLHFKNDYADFTSCPKFSIIRVDVAILDGGEFCGMSDWEAVSKMNPRLVILDDTQVIKNEGVLKKLEEEGWRTVLSGTDRNGWAILENPEESGKRRRNKKVISFCLWGNKPIYCQGVIENAKLAMEFYPDWECWVYTHIPTVPREIIEELQRYPNVRIISKMEGRIRPRRYMLWRFEPADNPEVFCFISRDTDSRITLRESLAVKEWLSSGKSLHIMRDHPQHYPTILGGMFGIKCEGLEKAKSFPTWEAEVDEFYRYATEETDDQLFLQNAIYNRYGSDRFIHDEVKRYEGLECRQFPLPWKDYHYVGCYVNPDGSLDKETRETLRRWISMFAPTRVGLV